MSYIPARGLGTIASAISDPATISASLVDAGLPPLCSQAAVGQQCTPDDTSSFVECPDGSMVPPGMACPTPASAFNTPPTPGLPWCSQAKVGQACNPDTAAQAAGLNMGLTKSLFGQTGIVGTLTSPLGLAAVGVAGYMIHKSMKRRGRR